MDKTLLHDLESRYVLFSCEGTAEEVVMNKLIDADLLLVPRERIVLDPRRFTPYTRIRKADQLFGTFMNQNYCADGSEGLSVIRVTDSSTSRFKVPRQDKELVSVHDVLTRPEIEMLIILKEGKYRQWMNRRNASARLKPSEFVKDDLGFGRSAKSKDFLDSYWADVSSLCSAIQDYAHVAKRAKDENCLADLLKSA